MYLHVLHAERLICDGYRKENTSIYIYSRPNHTNTLIDSLEVLPPEVVWLVQDWVAVGTECSGPQLGGSERFEVLTWRSKAFEEP